MTILTEKPTFFVIARKNDLLEKKGEHLQIIDSQSQEVRQKIPAIALRDIVIFGDINLDSSIISLAEKHFLPIHFLSNGGKFKGSLIFNFSKNVFLRNRQLNNNNDLEHKLKIAKKFVASKIHNQNIFLQKIRAKGRIEFDGANAKNLDELRGFDCKSRPLCWISSRTTLRPRSLSQ